MGVPYCCPPCHPVSSRRVIVAETESADYDGVEGRQGHHDPPKSRFVLDQLTNGHFQGLSGLLTIQIGSSIDVAIFGTEGKGSGGVVGGGESEVFEDIDCLVDQFVGVGKSNGGRFPFPWSSDGESDDVWVNLHFSRPSDAEGVLVAATKGGLSGYQQSTEDQNRKVPHQLIRQRSDQLIRQQSDYQQTASISSGLKNHKSRIGIFSAGFNQVFSELLLELTSLLGGLEEAQVLLLNTLHKFSLFFLHLPTNQLLQLILLCLQLFGPLPPVVLLSLQPLQVFFLDLPLLHLKSYTYQSLNHATGLELMSSQIFQSSSFQSPSPGLAVRLICRCDSCQGLVFKQYELDLATKRLFDFPEHLMPEKHPLSPEALDGDCCPFEFDGQETSAVLGPHLFDLSKLAGIAFEGVPNLCRHLILHSHRVLLIHLTTGYYIITATPTFHKKLVPK